MMALSLGCQDPGTCQEDLACATDIETECEGLYTQVTIPVPSGCTGSTLTHDIPEDGFQLGETAVHFSTESGEQQCSLGVRVFDTTAPDLSCSETSQLALTVPTEELDIPQPDWSDRCDSSPILSTNLDTLETGWNTIWFTVLTWFEKWTRGS